MEQFGEQVIAQLSIWNNNDIEVQIYKLGLLVIASYKKINEELIIKQIN